MLKNCKANMELCCLSNKLQKCRSHSVMSTNAKQNIKTLKKSIYKERKKIERAPEFSQMSLNLEETETTFKLP